MPAFHEPCAAWKIWRAIEPEAQPTAVLLAGCRRRLLRSSGAVVGASLTQLWGTQIFEDDSDSVKRVWHRHRGSAYGDCFQAFSFACAQLWTAWGRPILVADCRLQLCLGSLPSALVFTTMAQHIGGEHQQSIRSHSTPS